MTSPMTQLTQLSQSMLKSTHQNWWWTAFRAAH
ncbi:MAG: Tryptophan leader peptide [Streptomyces sp.]|jgi:hypothetical protein|nr:Tryptophan leader peptide [Streptomyces sp.]